MILITQSSLTVSSGSQYDLGSCVINTSVDRTFKVKNNGTADLSLTGSPRVAMSGAGQSSFTVTVQPVAQIPPGGSGSFTLRFTPIDLGTKTVTLTVGCNDPNCASYTLSIIGEGTVAPESEIHISQGGTEILSGSSRDLGSSLVGVARDVVFTVENRGSGDLNLTATPAVAISGADHLLFDVSVQPVSPIAPGGSGSFSIRFTPVATGLKTAIVSIPTNDADLDYYTFTITETGTVSQIRVTQGGTQINSGGKSDAGSAVVGASRDASFVVENLGSGPLILSGTPAVAVSGANGGMFAVVGQPTSPIAPGGNANFIIRFTPTSFGGKTATVTIANNDQSASGFAFTITGVGAAVVIPKTGQTVSYGTGDDGDLQRGVAWPSPRFTNNGDGTMTDTMTGLMWEQSPASTFRFWSGTIQTVFMYVTSLSLGGHTDWRVPNLRELRSLVNYGTTPTTWLSAQGFANVSTLDYWTSTSCSTGIMEWAIYMNTGGSYPYQSTPMSDTAYAWAVRGTSAFVARTGQGSTYHTGDDGALQKGVAWPSPRFTDNADGTMTDSLTGLVWEKSPDVAAKTWATALTYANGLDLGGCTDWRLPNINELETLAIYEDPIASTWLGTQGFTNVQTSGYWASSSVSGYTNNAWCVWIGFGSEEAALKSDAHYALAVRGGN